MIHELPLLLADVLPPPKFLLSVGGAFVCIASAFAIGSVVLVVWCAMPRSNRDDHDEEGVNPFRE